MYIMYGLIGDASPSQNEVAYTQFLGTYTSIADAMIVYAQATRNRGSFVEALPFYTDLSNMMFVGLWAKTRLPSYASRENALLREQAENTLVRSNYTSLPVTYEYPSAIVYAVNVNCVPNIVDKLIRDYIYVRTDIAAGICQQSGDIHYYRLQEPGSGDSLLS